MDIFQSLKMISERLSGKQIAKKVQFEWDQNFDEPIGFVIGDEWKVGNLSYHLKSRPKWKVF